MSGPPIRAIWCGKPPAPRPSSKRPPLRTSREAAVFAITAGGRSGRVAEAGKNGNPRGLGQQRGDEREGVDKACLVGVVLDSHELQPAVVGGPHQLAGSVERVPVGDDGDPVLGHHAASSGSSSRSVGATRSQIASIARMSLGCGNEAGFIWKLMREM